ncbi:MAG: type II toxin-antitoxin system VapB family antitoxin [Solirubrobacteraceae bacterium]|jgi:hypothetical protein|nr:type II toxin-antitoxin system VapB family antitoxin [Solirubrobacteraceae bacterium]MCU0506335.1 type II toxin-antitoxin system VapB family antitoxin [Chloroflexota bacterium]
MRTTITIDDDLLREAKQRAAAEGRTLSDLVGEGLRERLARHEAPPPRPFRLVTFGGRGLRPGVDLSSNAAVLDLLDED